ncbi:hypothetical protein HK098_002193 [Nowakowskiella sp. JEL0407]|nr:hypothetical protein HK098_002193 [Nowakowskiella sp. JEL0407]
MILTIGASGEVGGYVLEYAHAKGLTIRAASRNPTKSAEACKIPGIAWVKFDLSDVSTFESALEGIDQVFLYHGPNLDEFVNVAKIKGVKLIVFLSSLAVVVPEEPGRVNFSGKNHRADEQIIESSGIPFVFLRPGEFCKNEARLAGMVKSGNVTVCYPQAKSFRIHERDIAEVAVEAFMRPELVGTKPVLIHLELVSTEDAMRMIGEKLGREIRVTEIPESEGVLNFRKVGMLEPMITSYFEFKRDAMDGNKYFPRSREIEDILGKPARSFKDWVDENIAYFQ